LKLFANVKIAMQCFENFGGVNAPNAPPPGGATAIRHNKGGWCHCQIPINLFLLEACDKFPDCWG